MWPKLLKSVVLTRRISNAGMTFVQVFDKLSSSGRYVSLLQYAFLNRSKPVFRIGHQAVMLKPYAATIHPLLQFVHPPLTLDAPLN